MANFGGENGEFDRTETRAKADWNDLEKIRERWKGNLVVKGVLNESDAIRLKAAGVDAIQVSSHGGRQLDSAPPPIMALKNIRAAVGPDFPLFYDSGIRSGEDVVKAYVLGANFVFLGRAMLYALAANAETGAKAFWNVLSDETSITMAQLGLSALPPASTNLLWSDAMGSEQVTTLGNR